MKKILLIASITILLFSCTPSEVTQQKTQNCETVIAREHRFTYYDNGKVVSFIDWTERVGSALPYRKDCQEINTYKYIGEFIFTTSETSWHKREDRYVIRQK